MNNREKYFTDKGFTLIEMMVVVAIVAILAAVGIPQYKKYMLNAKTTEAVTAIKQIADAMKTYYDTHGQFPADMINTVQREEYGPVDAGGWGGHNYRAISNDLHTLDISSSMNWSYWVAALPDAGPGVFIAGAQPIQVSSDVNGKTMYYISDLDACGVTSANKELFDRNFYKAILYTSWDDIINGASAAFNNVIPNCTNYR